MNPEVVLTGRPTHTEDQFKRQVVTAKTSIQDLDQQAVENVTEEGER